MNENTPNTLSRRELLKDVGVAAAVATSTLAAAPFVHAAGDETIRIALVGCGGRGGGAAENALSSKQGPTKLVAMADVFPEKLETKFKQLSKIKPSQVDVPQERRFVGFDAYKKAIDCLKPNDVVIFATPPAFRWVHFTYAIEKGVNVFMEKPITVDGPSTKKMFELADLSMKKNIKVGVGLMCRHCEARGELFDRIKSGQIGDIEFLRAYRRHGHVAYSKTDPKLHPKPDTMSDLLYQIQRFHSFLWASGGLFSDFYIHNIDECCWMKDAWPVNAKACGGRHYRGNCIDQNFDTYSVEYTFADGAKLFLEGRCMDGCAQEFASYAHGTKGSAVISENSHYPAHSRIYKSQDMTANPVWEFGRAEPNPYQVEWEHLMAAIRADKPYNEVKRGAEASLVTSMGRMAAHTGRIITREDILNSQELAPTVDQLTMESPAPLAKNKDGLYPVPQPGLLKKNAEF